jgi:alpha-D-ribose 1-methylphosphonate 5-triphosphate synthase subunit PhnL
MLRIEHLSKTFQLHILGAKTIEGFSDVSFEVREGQIFGLKGRSGAGKSSVLKCIFRTYLSNAGSITYQSDLFGEIDLTTATEQQIVQLRKTEISYMTQFLRVIPRISAIDIISEPLVSKGESVEKARRQAAEIMARLYIPERLFDASPATFSGGEQQRINFAAGIIAKPKLLLLDEPTASLDVKSMDAVIQLLLELKEAGTTMVAIFHDKKTMNKVADEVYYLHTTRKKSA